jgi:hypothetical protein
VITRSFQSLALAFHSTALMVVTLVVSWTASASADTVQAFCPQCGRVHAHPSPTMSPSVIHGSAVTSQPSTPVAQASFQPVQRAASGVSNVLATLNAQRARQGVGQLAFDPQLQAVAEQRAALMARTGNKSHPPGSFAPGRYEGVGWSSSFSPSGVSACYTSDNRMRAAGAAMARGRDGVYFAVVYR